MLNPDADDLQVIPSSDDNDDEDGADELRRRRDKLARKGVDIASPEFTSPIGSPRGESSLFAKQSFLLEMKRRSRKKRRTKVKGNASKTSGADKSEGGSSGDVDVESFEKVGRASDDDTESGDDEEDDWEGGSLSPTGSYLEHVEEVEQLLESCRNRERDKDTSIFSQPFEFQMEMCQQLREKEQTILTLESKVRDMGEQLVDLQDTLTEKEKLLNSKNDAVTCMINQYKQSAVEKEAELTKTQEILFETEKKLGTVEESWKTEKDRLNTEIKKQSQRIRDLEDTNTLLQTARVEQTSRDIGLEEKLKVLKDDRDHLTQENVRMQTKLDDTLKEKGELELSILEKENLHEVAIAELKIEYEASSIATKKECQTKMANMKKQFAVKLKAIKESASAESSTNEGSEIQNLQTQIQELQSNLAGKLEENVQFTTTIGNLTQEVENLQHCSASVHELQTRNDALMAQIEDLNDQLMISLKVQREENEKSELLMKIAELENQMLESEKGKESTLEEELRRLKGEKQAVENDFNQRLSEYETNFTQAIGDYDKQIEEKDNRVCELSAASETLKTQMEEKDGRITQLSAEVGKLKDQSGKMKQQFKLKLKAAREGQSQTQTEGETSSVNSEAIDKNNALKSRVAELEAEVGQNLWLQEELIQLKQDKETLQQQYDTDVEAYRSQQEVLETALRNEQERVLQLQTQLMVSQEEIPLPLTSSSFEVFAEPQQNLQVPPSPNVDVDTVDSQLQKSRIEELEHQVASLEEEKGTNLLSKEDEISGVMEEKERLETELKKLKEEHEAKTQDFEEQLKQSNDKMLRLKRQFQLKLKEARTKKESEGSPTTSSSPSPCPDVEQQARITQLENRIAELEDEKGNLLLQMVDFEEQQAKRTVTMVHDGGDSDSSNIASFEEEKIRLEITLAEKEEEIRQLQQQFDELTLALSQKNMEVDKLMQNCSEMELSLKGKIDEISSSVSRKDDEINSRIANLEQQLTSSSLSLISKEEEVQTLKEQLMESEAKFDKMTTLASEYEGIAETIRNQDKDNLMSLKEELENIKGRADSSQSAYESMEASYVSRLNEEARNLNEKISQLQTISVEYDHLKEKFDKRETEIETLSAQLAIYQEQIDDYKRKAELAESAEECFQTVDLFNNSSSAELEEKDRQFRQIEQQLLEDLSIKSQKIDELYLQQENDKWAQQENEEKISSLKGDISEKSRQLKELSEQIEALKTESETKLQPLLEENESIKQQLTESSGRCDSLKIEIENLRNYYAPFEASYSQMYNDIGHKTAQIEQLIAAEKEQQERITSLKTETEKLAEMASSISRLEHDNASLQQQSEQYATESSSLRSKLTDLTNEYIQLRESLEIKESEVIRLRQDGDTLQSEYSHENNELKLKITSLMDQLSECESEVGMSAGKMREIEDALSDMRLKLEEKSKVLEETENTVFEKDEELLKLKESIKEIEEQHKLASEEKYIKFAEDMNTTFDQLTLTASENVKLHDDLRKKEQELEEAKKQFEMFSASYDYGHEASLYDNRETLNLENQLQENAQTNSALMDEDKKQKELIEKLSSTLAERDEKLENLSNEMNGMLAGLQETLSAKERDCEDKHLRIRELETEVEQLKNEVTEARYSCQQFEQQLQSLQYQHQSYVPQQQQNVNVWNTPAPPSYFLEAEPLQQSVEAFRIDPNSAMAVQSPHSHMQGYQPQPYVDPNVLQEKDNRIYELEVQLAELQINADDSNSQTAEMTELRTSLEVLSYRIKELEIENEGLKRELASLRVQQEHHQQELLSRVGREVTPGTDSDQPVDEPLIVPSTAYVTTEDQTQTSSTADSSSAALVSLQKEVKELKIKNGRAIQRFKQLKDKYDQVVKENEGLKTKKQFSLDSAFEDEFLTQVTAKDALLEEKGKQLTEIQSENQRLVEKIDLLERGTDRLTEMKEEQDRQMQGLMAGRRTLETEISALKWKLEEMENISLARADTPVEKKEDGADLGDRKVERGYFDMAATNYTEQENTSLKHQNAALVQEIGVLRTDIDSHKKSVDDVNERNQQLEEEIEKLQDLQAQYAQQFQNRGIITAVPSQQSITSSGTTPLAASAITPNNQAQSLDVSIASLQHQLSEEQREKATLERKIELLQSKISEIEISEIKCFEESLMLKSWTRQLELDNLKLQRELEKIYASLQDGGDTTGLKAKVLQDEVIRLVDALQDRDKRCEQLTLEITRLLEERDTLQLKLSNVLRHNVNLNEEVSKGREPSSPPYDVPSYGKEELQKKLDELEQMNYTMEVDLRREREARRIVQEQLFFSSSSRGYTGSGGYGKSPVRSRSPAQSSIPPPPTSVSTTSTPQSMPGSSPPFVPSTVAFPHPQQQLPIPTADAPPAATAAQFYSVDVPSTQIVGAQDSQQQQPLHHAYQPQAHDTVHSLPRSEGTVYGFGQPPPRRPKLHRHPDYEYDDEEHEPMSSCSSRSSNVSTSSSNASTQTPFNPLQLPIPIESKVVEPKVEEVSTQQSGEARSWAGQLLHRTLELFIF